MQNTVLRVVDVAPGRALLAAHGVHVRYALLDDGKLAALLLADDLAVADVDAERAAAGVAVDGVAAPAHLVPLPLVAISVGPVPRCDGSFGRFHHVSSSPARRLRARTMRGTGAAISIR